MSSYPLLESLGGPADLKQLPLEQLEELGEEIRHAICEQVSQTGGHLAPNLGVVELTLALHYVFDFVEDRLLFDVGHQCYPHKLLTGRFGLLPKLRQSGGLAGFPEPRESDFDLFSVGHAGSAISTAVGMARGDALIGQAHRKVVALVGDSSIVNGLALEGINNAGTLKRQMLIVLNDNGMSIGDPQGALATYFDKVRLNPLYKEIKHRAKDLLKRLPGAASIESALEEAYHRLGEMTKAAIAHEHLFDRFGLLCVGPIDGHDLPTLLDMLNEVKDLDLPVLLHAKTVKGKGFDFSTSDPTTFHSPKPFKVNGCRVEVQSGGRSFTTAFAEALSELMAEDATIVATTAGMPDGTGLAKVSPKFPERVFDVGIAESHATDMSAGMAKSGLRPFTVIYSTFLQRAFDQVFQEVSLQGLAVRFCMDRAGLVGGDGAVHHGFLDIAFLRGLPGLVVTAAIDEPTLKAALRFMQTYDAGPSSVRYPRDNVPDPVQGDATPPFALGKANKLAAGEDLHILAFGFPAIAALEARQQLHQQGYSVSVYDARFAKPIDVELLGDLIATDKPILTVEDHAIAGGFGTAVLEAANENALDASRISRLGLPDRFIHQGSRRGQLAEAGIDAAGIARTVRRMLETHAGQTAASIEVGAARPARAMR